MMAVMPDTEPLTPVAVPSVPFPRLTSRRRRTGLRSLRIVQRARTAALDVAQELPGPSPT